MEKEKRDEKELESQTTSDASKVVKTASKQKPKASTPKKKKYPIVLVAENYIVYINEKGNNVWVKTKSSDEYKVSEEYEAAVL